MTVPVAVAVSTASMPSSVPRTTAPPGMDGPAEDLEEGGDVAGQAVDADQDGGGRRAGPDPLDQPGDQRQIALTADHATQPQARRYSQRQGHPDLRPDLLHPQFVRLHMLGVDPPLL